MEQLSQNLHSLLPRKYLKFIVKIFTLCYSILLWTFPQETYAQDQMNYPTLLPSKNRSTLVLEALSTLSQSLNGKLQGSNIRWFLSKAFLNDWMTFSYQNSDAYHLNEDELFYFSELLLSIGELEKAYYIYYLAFNKYPKNLYFTFGYALISDLYKNYRSRSILLWKHFFRLLREDLNTFQNPFLVWKEDTKKHFCNSFFNTISTAKEPLQFVCLQNVHEQVLFIKEFLASEDF